MPDPYADYEMAQRLSRVEALANAPVLDEEPQTSNRFVEPEPAPQVDQEFMQQLRPNQPVAVPDYAPQVQQPIQGQPIVTNYQPSPQLQQTWQRQAWEQEYQNASPEHRRGMEQMSLQARLQQISLTQQEEMRLGRVRNAMAMLSQRDDLSPVEKADLHFQLLTNISPLQNRQREAQRIHTELQNKAIKQQMQQRAQQYEFEQAQIARVQGGLGPVYSPDGNMVYTERGWIPSPAREMGAAQQQAAQDRHDRLLRDTTNDIERQIRQEVEGAAQGAYPSWFQEPDIVRQPGSTGQAAIEPIRRAALQQQADARAQRMIQQRMSAYGMRPNAPGAIAQEGQPRQGPRIEDFPEPTQEPQPWSLRQPRTQEHVQFAQAYQQFAQEIESAPPEIRVRASADLERIMQLTTQYGTALAMPPTIQAEYAQILGRLQRLPVSQRQPQTQGVPQAMPRPNVDRPWYTREFRNWFR